MVVDLPNKAGRPIRPVRFQTKPARLPIKAVRFQTKQAVSPMNSPRKLTTRSACSRDGDGSENQGGRNRPQRQANPSVSQLQQLKAYVQAVADADPENSANLIESAGLAVKQTAARHPRGFDARPGAVSGTVKLLARAAGQRAAYEWQYSIDGGKTWLFAPSSLQAKTTVTGLAPGSTVQFRYRAVTKAGEGDWSQAIALIVK